VSTMLYDSEANSASPICPMIWLIFISSVDFKFLCVSLVVIKLVVICFVMIFAYFNFVNITNKDRAI
jgi:hypothetical protein